MATPGLDALQSLVEFAENFEFTPPDGDPPNAVDFPTPGQVATALGPYYVCYFILKVTNADFQVSLRMIAMKKLSKS